MNVSKSQLSAKVNYYLAFANYLWRYEPNTELKSK